MDFTQRLNSILAEDANTFADSFGLPRISPWIVQQYNKGHQSFKDYENIVRWVTNSNPNIQDYDFYSALKQAQEYCSSMRQDGFDPYTELQSKNVVIDFDSGKKWLAIGPEDCNTICHRLRYDCSAELQAVVDGDCNCYALQDPQDNTICIFLDSEPYRLIGQFGNPVTNCHQEIKGLCVRKGIDIVPEAYSDLELPKALATKELNIDDVPDLSTVMKRLSSIDIINCNLINYAHYSTLKSVYDLYNKTGHNCLLVYAICYLVANGHTKTQAYNTVKAAVSQNPEVASTIENDGSDNRFYIKLMDDAAAEISSLQRH